MMSQQSSWLFEAPHSQAIPTYKSFYANQESFSHPEFEDEWEMQNSNVYGWLGETQWELATPSSVRRTCPQTASETTLRCTSKTPKVCPAIPNLLCMAAVNGVPFEYVDAVKKDRGTNLIIVSKRLRPRTQRFIPTVETALSTFISNMNQFGLPIEAILTLGSYFCRCISNMNNLSNHSFGDAIDIAGLRWKQSGISSIPSRETIVHNFHDAHEKAILRRINACLRLSFTTVIDYHRSDHRDHFHCDLNRGRERNPLQKTTLVFVQESLNLILGTKISENGEFNLLTKRFLLEFCRSSGWGNVNENSLKNRKILNRIFDALFRAVASRKL
jgi:Extensin-like protein C-terminus